MAGERKAGADRISELAWDIVKAIVQGSVLYLLAAPAGLIKANPLFMAVAVTVVSTVVVTTVSTAAAGQLARVGIFTIGGFPAPLYTSGVGVGLLGGGLNLYLYRSPIPYSEFYAILLTAAGTAIAWTAIVILRPHVREWARKRTEEIAMREREQIREREARAYLDRPWG